MSQTKLNYKAPAPSYHLNFCQRSYFPPKLLPVVQIWWAYLKAQLSYYNWKIVSASLLTRSVNIHLDKSKVISDIWPRRWTSVPIFIKIRLVLFREITTSVTNERTNEPTKCPTNSGGNNKWSNLQAVQTLAMISMIFSTGTRSSHKLTSTYNFWRAKLFWQCNTETSTSILKFAVINGAIDNNNIIIIVIMYHKLDHYQRWRNKPGWCHFNVNLLF